MTNAQIIFNNQLELMKDGIIKSTGRQIEVVNAAGEVSKINEPEPIHTYASWKQLGRQVKKGEKSKAQFPIWKYTNKKEDMEVTYIDGTKGVEEVDNSKMFMKLSFFFTLEQTEPIKK